MGIPVFMHLTWTYLCLFISPGHTCVYLSHLGIPVFIYLTWAYLCLCISPGSYLCLFISPGSYLCLFISPGHTCHTGHSYISSPLTILWWTYTHVCLGSLCCCMTHLMLNFSSQTDTLTFFCSICWYNPEFIGPSMMASRPGPEAAKQPQTMILPPPCFTQWVILQALQN